jgi:hypothetical protein
MNPLDKLLRAFEIIKTNEVPISEPPSKVDSTETETTFESTCHISVRTIRHQSQRFISNIPDEKLAWIIETAISAAEPLIKDSTSEQIEMYLELAKRFGDVFQATLIQHTRNGVLAGVNKKLTPKELDEIMAESKKKKEELQARRDRIHQKEKARTLKDAKKASTPIWEQLTKSSDKNKRNAGKFVQQQIKQLRCSESTAFKNWNDLMAQNNQKNLIITGKDGTRIEELLARRESKKGSK